jgi:hypothetical protein
MAQLLHPEQHQFAYMANVLGIGNNEIRHALRTQGLEMVNDFVALTENDIEDVCKIIRRPGITIPKPAFGGGQAGRGQPLTLPIPGMQIEHLHETRLKMLRYVVFHIQRIQRNFDPAIETMDMLQEIYLRGDRKY